MRLSLAWLCVTSAACLVAQEGSFLDTFFRHDTGIKVETSTVAAGYLAKEVTSARLPVALLLPSGPVTDEHRRWAREVAGIGFAALVADHDADKATEWIADQPFADPQRIAAVAWSDRIPSALRVAPAAKWKALVLWGTQVAPEARIPILAIPPRKDPEQAWVEIYEFLGRYAEDATPQIARVVDLMRVINSNAGVRGQLAQALTAEPASTEEWELAKSRAAVLAEAGNLLLTRRPATADPDGWKQKATEYRDSATALYRALERRDFTTTRHCLQELAHTCGACHSLYR